MMIRSLLVAAILWSSAAVAQTPFLKTYRLNDTTAVTTSRPPSNSISQIETDRHTIYLGTGNGAARSTDGGRTWSSFAGNRAFANEGIFAIAARNDTAWIATGYDTQTGDQSIQTGSGYAVTIDGGNGWRHVKQPLDTCIQLSSSNGHRICQSILTIPYGINDSVGILAVTTPVANVSYDISLSTGTVWVSSWSSGLRKSTDGGATWERILLPLDFQNSLSPYDTLWTYSDSDPLHVHKVYPDYDVVKNDNLKAFSVLAIDDSTIWCGTAGGVNRSTDGGRSWTKFNHQNQASPIPANWVIGLGAQPAGGGTYRIWTTNWVTNDVSERYGISYSDDDGRTWTALLPGVKAYKFAFHGTTVYVATDNGIYRSADGGASFSRFSTFADPVNHQVIANSAVYSVAVLADTVFVGSADGLVSTIDSPDHPFGETWTVHRTAESVAGTQNSYAYPNPFSPKLGPVRIHYATSGSAPVQVRIDIFDFGMNRVRTIINGSRAGNTEFDELWDGARDDGRMAANGTYFYRIVSGADEPRFGKIIVLQ